MGGHGVPEEKINQDIIRPLIWFMNWLKFVILSISMIILLCHLEFSRKERTYISIAKINIGIIQTLKTHWN